MITEKVLLDLLDELESFRVERTNSTTDTAKFSEAVCAFAPTYGRTLVAQYILR